MKSVYVRDKKFFDKSNQEVKLKGINIVCKDKNKGYVETVTDKDIELLKSLGFNTIRLGIMWNALEPKPGKYDENYLGRLDKLIETLTGNGFYVYLDMHQDLFSEVYCDGAPKWATLSLDVEHVETELWSEAYLMSPAVWTAFDKFWEDAPVEDGVGVMTHFIETWKMLVKRYIKNENIIGYDLFNEPFPGSMGANVMPVILSSLSELLGLDASLEELASMWMDNEKKLALLEKFEEEESYEKIIRNAEAVTREFDENVLSPFYERMIKAIREVDEDGIIFLEANYFCNTGIESYIRVPEGRNLAYSPHGYDLLVDTEDYSANCEGRLNVIFRTHKKVSDRLGLPMLVGEWGCFPNATDVQINQAKYLIGVFDKYNASNTYYDFSHIEGNRIIEAFS